MGSSASEHAGRQLAQVHARKLHGAASSSMRCRGQQVMGEAAQALAFVDDDAAELLVQLGRQIGVFQHFGVAADGGERRAQLVSHVADEGRLSALFQREVVLLRLHGLDEALEVGGQLVGFEKAAVRLEGHIGTCAVRGVRFARRRRGSEMKCPMIRLNANTAHADGDEQQKTPSTRGRRRGGRSGAVSRRRRARAALPAARSMFAVVLLFEPVSVAANRFHQAGIVSGRLNLITEAP